MIHEQLTTAVKFKRVITMMGKGVLSQGAKPPVLRHTGTKHPDREVTFIVCTQVKQSCRLTDSVC